MSSFTWYARSSALVIAFALCLAGRGAAPVRAETGDGPLLRLDAAPKGAADAADDAGSMNDEALAEAQARSALAPSSPFPGHTVDGPLREGWYDFGRGAEPVSFVEVDGMALFQGDVVLGPAAVIGANGGSSDRVESTDQAESTILRMNGWPGGRIVYEIDPWAFPPGSAQRRDIDSAIYAWNSQTLVRLVPRSHDNGGEHYVHFVADNAGCFASIGNAARWESPQTINLGAGCDLAAATHEIGHTVGLLHEQARSDRDAYLNINWWNIPTDRTSRAQYQKHTDDPSVSAMDWGPFDYESVMLYQSLGIGVDPAVPVYTRRGCDGWDTSPRCIVERNASLTTYDKAGVTRILTGDPSSFRLVGDSTGQCLEVQDGSLEDGGWIVSRPCGTATIQRWYGYDVGATDGVVVISVHSRLCVTRAGAGYQQRPCTGDPSQRFNVRSVETSLPELTPLDPWTVYFSHTERTGVATQITFANASKRTMYVYWVDDRGRYVPHTSLAPGASVRQDTFADHLWAIVNDDNEIETGFLAIERPARATIR